MHEAEDVVRRAAVNRDPRTLRCCENSHHFVQAGFHGKRVYVRPRHHNLPYLDLREFHGAQNEFFFAGRYQSAFAGLLNAFAGLLNLDLELFGRMRNTMNLR